MIMIMIFRLFFIIIILNFNCKIVWKTFVLFFDYDFVRFKIDF